MSLWMRLPALLACLRRLVSSEVARGVNGVDDLHGISSIFVFNPSSGSTEADAAGGKVEGGDADNSSSSSLSESLLLSLFILDRTNKEMDSSSFKDTIQIQRDLPVLMGRFVLAPH
ncbi:hypothetical protein DFH05DRAFT_1483713 [Lentinula detonsa]|uniref:Secreted protein n=1 Tax=Lentinula detonsa TaxID=2804962 RepID=A0A9W8P3F9_9AGAR|nr:hypothetical protein DFH05DRAFT_1483713 [Lentinula detonsa]